MLTATLAIVVTAAWYFGMDVSQLKPTPVIQHGEYWRLFTSLFIQIDVWHTGFNLYWLWLLGASLERVYGSLKTAGMLLLFATGTSTLEYTFTAGGAGLGGVVYGLFGVMWVVSRRDPRFHSPVGSSLAVLFAVWLLYCNMAAARNAYAVSNIACIFGLVLGLLTGAAILLPERRNVIRITIAAMVVLSLLGATLARPLFNGYEQGQKGFDALTDNRNAEAVAWFQKSLAHLPYEAWMWSDLGIAYSRTGNKSAAQDAYRHAKELGLYDTHTQR
jgi:membrane associated rhomboid family serine protease